MFLFLLFLHLEPLVQRKVLLFFMFKVLLQVPFQLFLKCFTFLWFFKESMWFFNVKATFFVFHQLSQKLLQSCFLHNSVIECFGTEIWSKRNIPSSQRNWIETNPWDFVSLNISYKSFKYIFSVLSRVSPSITINKLFFKGSLC